MRPLLYSIGFGFLFAWALMLWPVSVEGDRRVIKSASGYQTVSMLDGGRTGLYYDSGELVGLLRPHAARVVLLGLGGGEMLRAARRTLPNAELEGVENNQLTAFVASRQFGMDQLDVRIALDDADNYVRRMGERSADAILVDLYDDANLPEKFRTTAFFRRCRHALTPNGLVLMNVWPPTLVPSVELAMREADFSVSRKLYGENTVLIAEW